MSTEDGTVLIDPPDPGEDGWRSVDLLEPFAGVWLTNRNHSRAAAAFRERYGRTVWAHEADADRLEAGADRTLAGDTTIAGVHGTLLTVQTPSRNRLRRQRRAVGDGVTRAPTAGGASKG